MTAEQVSARRSRAGWWRLGLLGLWVVGGSVAVALLDLPARLMDDDGRARLLSSVQELVDGLGPAAPLVFLVAAAVLTVALFPRLFLSVAAGLAFGVVLGTVLSVVGTSIGAAAAYYVGRRAGRQTVVEHEEVGGRLARADAWLGDHGFVSVLYSRLVPVSPFSLVNYVWGLSSVRFRDFFWGTLIGSIPTTAVLTALGHSLRDWNSPLMLAAGGLTVLFALFGLVVQRVQGAQPASGKSGPATPKPISSAPASSAASGRRRRSCGRPPGRARP